jgi:hypothetical protein
MFVGWKDLGLPNDRRVHVFDFWNREYLGAWEKGVSVELPPTSTRVLTLVPATDQIQLVSTSRHITQGWWIWFRNRLTRRGMCFRVAARL